MPATAQQRKSAIDVDVAKTMVVLVLRGSPDYPCVDQDAEVGYKATIYVADDAAPGSVPPGLVRRATYALPGLFSSQRAAAITATRAHRHWEAGRWPYKKLSVLPNLRER